MISKLGFLGWKRFQGEPQWIRCFAHILNLIVKAILRPFGRQKKGTVGAEELEDEESSDKEEPQNLIKR